ncbi:unnamed protein product [Candidula unifasciata]|uniref:G-protein coupled receptors family 2 profile 2 domain-containing protein n=1 Tax=Candidula unifasciata TaxID=100452 RepID=A0A8S4A459_9EUPU|nr:unnamed protein product [Candidula unifasciata]
MVLIPDSRKFYVSNFDVKRIAEIIFNDLSEISEEIKFKIRVRVVSRSPDTSQAFLQEVVVVANLISNTKDNRDEFESNVLRLAREARAVQESENTTVNLITTLLGEGFAPFLHEEDNRSYTEHLWTTSSKISLKGGCWQSKGKNTNSSYVTPDWSTVETLYTAQCSKGGFRLKQWQHKDKFIDITNTLFCQFVAINFTDISFNGSSIVVRFSYNNRHFTLTSAANISVFGDEIRICVDLFKNLTESPLTEFSDNISDYRLVLATFYLEILCSSLSAVCLLTSFVTYCLFPVLRTLPGLNNMCLTLSLALAHIFLFVTAEFGIAGKLNQHYCLVHAILVHYFWLATFMWMSVCCIHMYRVFTCQSTKFINTRSDSRRHLHYCISAFGSPVVIIVIYVLVCMCLTAGSSNGYSNTYCFLDVTESILTTLLSLVLPLCLTIFINGVLYVLTIREMLHVTRLRRSTVESKGVLTYVKLSTLTGTSYVVCGAALHLHSPVINLLVSPVMCLQGVFIFMSFICNKRVRNLYRELLRRHSDHVQSSSRSKRTAFTEIPASKHMTKSATEHSSF